MTGTSRGAAFFDLDRTLMSGSSGFFWARAAARAGYISRRRLALDAWENVKFRLRGSTDAGTDRVMTRVGAMLAGKRAKDFERLGPQVLAGVLPRLYPQMLDIAWQHQDAGRPVYIVTAASQETAAMIAHVLGFDGGLGTPLETVDGLYTGRLSGPFAYREGKPKLMRRLADGEGLDLGESYAYSDSESDLPMLRAVGHPVAVNPDGPLARVAREEGWDVLRFDRLGGRLKMLGGLAAATLLGAAGRTAAARRAGAR
jgi:HAD superfamily hydrolase (TIGR01490 family)